MQRQSRQSYLIVSGLPEETSGSLEYRNEKDSDKLKSLLAALNHNESAVLSNRRIGSRLDNSKPRLLRIQCSNREIKESILHKSKDLRKNDSFKNIYINPDLTKMERLKNKALREELRLRKNSGEDVLIHRGKVISKQEYNSVFLQKL